MYKEIWSIHGIKSVKFLNDDGDTVKGNQVYYSRSFYDDQERQGWLFGSFNPKKPQWVDDTLCGILIQALHYSIGSRVYACYEPQGRYNRLVNFEPCKDEELSLDDIDCGGVD